MTTRTTLAVRDPQVEAFLAHFEGGSKAAGGQWPWLDRLRGEAIERFAALGLPTTHDEDWKYTNIAPWMRVPYGPASAAAARLEGVAFAGLDTARIVLVNGRYSPALSSVGALPEGVTLSSLAEALARRPEFVERHLARYAQHENNALVALNTAFVSDGLFLEIPNGVVVERPIQLLFVSTGDGEPSVAYARNLIVAGRDSQATILETYAGLGGAARFTNAVSEVVAGEGAVMEHYRVQRESDRTFHFGSLHVQQERSSNFTSHNIALGAGLARNELSAVLAGEGAECLLNGLYVATGTQHVDNYTTMDHASPHATSQELYKGILDGAAQGVFHGRIIVRKDAQKTDAIQRNKNLLLSEKAVINTKPQLEIYADDVRCTHGATVGQVDEEAVFYLRSRGIGREEARSLLTYAFATEMLERLKLEGVREELAGALFAALAEGRTAREGL